MREQGRPTSTRSFARSSARWLAIAVTLTSLVGCAAGPGGAGDPEQRAVHIDTERCGTSRDRFGSGVAVGGSVIVTVAHLIVDAERPKVSVAGGPQRDAVVLAVDLQRDLAALHVDGLDTSDVVTGLADQGTTGRIVEAASSGTVDFVVERRVSLRIEDVLGTDRHSRIGYELASPTVDGDSGAGAYDDEGMLIGIVFASGDDGETTWLTATSEIEGFLAAVSPTDVYEPCG